MCSQEFLDSNTMPVILGACVFLLLYLYLGKTYAYWLSQKVEGKAPLWFVGNILPRLRNKVSMAEFDQNLYLEHGGQYISGLYEFLTPVIMIGDTNLLKSITIRDFDHFTDRSYFKFNQPIMDQMLLGLKGNVWKRVRAAMTPSFTSGKIKRTLPLIRDCSENLARFFHSHINQKCTTFEMKEVYEKFTMDTIASIAFGVNSDSLNDSQDEFTMAAARFFAESSWSQLFSSMSPLIAQTCKLLGISKFNKSPCDFFAQVISDTMKYRKTNAVRRSDFLQLLLDASVQERKINLNKAGTDDIEEAVLSDLVITAQCMLFYIAGYDTTATTLSFVSYCLALNPKAQQTVMEEVETVLGRHHGQISFETLEEMKYLDMVFSETLRLYPPAPRVDRRCTKDYLLPGTDLVIPKGMKVIIPIYSIHRDPQHYENPDKFDPERFSPKNRMERDPLTYIPFGSGSRNCIGRRFAMMEAKLAMVRLLQDFAFIPSHKTEIPIKYDCSSGLLKARSGVWVRLALRS